MKGHISQHHNTLNQIIPFASKREKKKNWRSLLSFFNLFIYFIHIYYNNYLRIDNNVMNISISELMSCFVCVVEERVVVFFCALGEFGLDAEIRCFSHLNLNQRCFTMQPKKPSACCFFQSKASTSHHNCVLFFFFVNDNCVLTTKY